MWARMVLFAILFAAASGLVQESFADAKADIKKKIPLRQGNMLMNATLIVPKAVYPHELNPVEYMTGVLSCVVPPPGTSGDQDCPNFAVSFYPRDNMDPSATLTALLEHPVPQADSVPARQFRVEPGNQLVFEATSTVYQLSLDRLFLPVTSVKHQWMTKTEKNHLLFLVTETCDSEVPCRAGLWIFALPTRVEGRASAYVTSVLVPLLNPVSWGKLDQGSIAGLYQWEDRFALVLPMAENAPVVAWMVKFREPDFGGPINIAHFEAHPVGGKPSGDAPPSAENSIPKH